MSKVPTPLWQNLVAIQVYGANTGVGKTVFSTLLGAHFLKRPGYKKKSLHYIKPVSTGPSSEADDLYFKKYAGGNRSTIFQFKDPVSPHVAARNVKVDFHDHTIVNKLFLKLQQHARSHDKTKAQKNIAIVETAGGVLSPGPSGTPQADIFRPMRLPVILVGDHRLGGIASTISAAESLTIRGYDIAAVVCFNDQSKYENADYLKTFFGERGIPTFELPWIPDLKHCSKSEEGTKMEEYYNVQSKRTPIITIANWILRRHTEQLANLDTLADRTREAIWHPFTQHKSIEKASDILVFDSAYGDFFQTKHTPKSMSGIMDEKEVPVFYPAFDGSASWWTQGLGHGNPELSLAASYAAGRYGHIMFAGATHEPAITLAERLLNGLGNPRLKKCFYTDDGSTAVEVGIKMALRAACKRYDWDGSTEEVGVLGLKGSYHGDTIGAMDASEPCVYNKKVDWYRGRGYWFDFPSVKMKQGRWLVEPPAGMEDEFGPPQSFDILNEVFNFRARGQAPLYEKYIKKVLDQLVKQRGKKFGALVMEPIILGAGGMLFVDPLFQQTLVKVTRSYKFTSEPAPAPEDPNSWTGLPVIFDEVFTGLYRLGRFSAASYLQTHPDISCHAKLLTGGLLPLSVTVASDSIFQAFWGDEKSEALLHGHSYTAHPIGCHVANTSLDSMRKLSRGLRWRRFRSNWVREIEGYSNKEGSTVESSTSEPTMAEPDTEGTNTAELQKAKSSYMEPRTDVSTESKAIWSMWTKKFVIDLSYHPRVDHVIAIGSVLAVSLKDEAGSGYTSNAAIGLRDALLNNASSSISKISVHSRVLGNVIYLMAAMTSTHGHLDAVEKVFIKTLNEVSGLATKDEAKDLSEEKQEE